MRFGNPASNKSVMVAFAQFLIVGVACSVAISWAARESIPQWSPLPTGCFLTDAVIIYVDCVAVPFEGLVKPILNVLIYLPWLYLPLSPVFFFFWRRRSRKGRP
jgi:hypothetical protein